MRRDSVSALLKKARASATRAPDGRFFEDRALEAEFISRVQAGVGARADFWEEFETDWVCLDCELMPWSAKAQELVRQQYAAVGAAARASLVDVVGALERKRSRRILRSRRCSIGIDNAQTAAAKYVDAYRRYCWPVQSLDDLKLAPFHLLATEGRCTRTRITSGTCRR